jgi:hypothetical protein
VKSCRPYLFSPSRKVRTCIQRLKKRHIISMEWKILGRKTKNKNTLA